MQTTSNISILYTVGKYFLSRVWIWDRYLKIRLCLTWINWQSLSFLHEKACLRSGHFRRERRVPLWRGRQNNWLTPSLAVKSRQWMAEHDGEPQPSHVWPIAAVGGHLPPFRHPLKPPYWQVRQVNDRRCQIMGCRGFCEEERERNSGKEKEKLGRWEVALERGRTTVGGATNDLPEREQREKPSGEGTNGMGEKWGEWLIGPHGSPWMGSLNNFQKLEICPPKFLESNSDLKSTFKIFK